MTTSGKYVHCSKRGVTTIIDMNSSHCRVEQRWGASDTPMYYAILQSKGYSAAVLYVPWCGRKSRQVSQLKLTSVYVTMY